MNKFTITYQVDCCNNCPHCRTSQQLHDDPFSSEPTDNFLWCTYPPPERGSRELVGRSDEKVQIPDWCVKLRDQKMFESGWSPYSSSM